MPLAGRALLAAYADLLRGLAWGRGRLGHPEGRVGLHVASILARIGGYPRMGEQRARQAHESEELTELERELCAAVVQRVLEEPEGDPEHCVADRRLAEGSAVGGELRQLLAGRVSSVSKL